jgi:serine protease Do
MTSRFSYRHFAMVFAGTVLAVLVMIRADVFEHISYAIEKGRLRAISEALPLEEVLRELDEPNRKVAQMVTPAVVHINTFGTINPDETLDAVILQGLRDNGLDVEPTLPPGHPSVEDRDRTPRQPIIVQTGLGSGFVIDGEKGHVLTNYHVIEGADRIEVSLPDGRRYQAQVVGADPETDLAILSIPAERLHTLSFGDSRRVFVGDEVFALGNPFGLDGTFSRGIVSALGRHTQISEVHYQGFIQTDAVINPGNSGGPLVNRRGEVIGVNTAIATESGSFVGVGFAIPSARIVELLPKLTAGIRVARGFLGVATRGVRTDRDIGEALGWLEDYGVVVQSVVPGSPAADAGLRDGDVLTEFNDERILGFEEFREMVARKEPHSSSTLRYWRDGAFETTEVVLAQRRLQQ